MRICEPQSFTRQTVKVWRGNLRLRIVEPRIAVTHVFHQEDDDVGFIRPEGGLREANQEETNADPNGDALSCRLFSLLGSGSLYQFASVARGTAITEPKTPVSDATNRVIFVPGQEEFGAPYTTFKVVASDGELDSTPGVATVNVFPSPVVTIVGPNQNSNGVTLSFTGLSNVTYFVCYSADLTNWSNLGSASQLAPGQFIYYDTSFANQVRRFFRIRRLPDAAATAATSWVYFAAFAPRYFVWME